MKNHIAFSIRILNLIFLGVLLSQPVFAKENPGNQEDPNLTVYSMPSNYLSRVKKMNAPQKLGIESYKELLDLFEKYNYTPEVWKKGVREIPRLYITEIGERWGSVSTKEMTVIYKKRIFFRGIAPLVLYANELIMMDRNRLLKLKENYGINGTLQKMDKIWLHKIG